MTQEAEINYHFQDGRKRKTTVSMKGGSAARSRFTIKLMRLMLWWFLPSWVSSKVLDLILYSFSFKGFLKLYKLLSSQNLDPPQTIKETSPLLEKLLKAVMGKNAMVFLSDHLPTSCQYFPLAKPSHKPTSMGAWETKTSGSTLL